MRILFHIVAGLVLGYGLASLLESIVHRAIYHASPWTRRFWTQYPRISGPFQHAYFSHGIVHHRWTFRQDFVTQFGDDGEQERLDRKIRGPQGALIRRERYGVTIRGAGFVWYYMPILPCIPLIGVVLGPWGLLGALPALAAYSLIPTFVHPYLHQSHDETVTETSPWMGWMLKTGYVQFLRRYHYLHHRYIDCNFNLLLGGDFILGRYRAPSTQDWNEMRRLGLVDARSRNQERAPLLPDA